MQTLGFEGARYNIRVNCLAPSAGTRMLDGLMSGEMSNTLSPGSVSPGVVGGMQQSEIEFEKARRARSQT